MYPKLPKISGIAVDLYFDHLLAKNWNEFHDVELDDFLNTFYDTTPKHQNHFTEDFLFVLSKMKNGRWMNQYRSFEGLTTACKNLSARIPFENVLYRAPEVFLELEQEVNNSFEKYMADAIPNFLR